MCHIKHSFVSYECRWYDIYYFITKLCRVSILHKKNATATSKTISHLHVHSAAVGGESPLLHLLLPRLCAEKTSMASVSTTLSLSGTCPRALRHHEGGWFRRVTMKHQPRPADRRGNRVPLMVRAFGVSSPSDDKEERDHRRAPAMVAAAAAAILASSSFATPAFR